MGSIAPSNISVSLLCLRACSVLCEFAKNSLRHYDIMIGFSESAQADIAPTHLFQKLVLNSFIVCVSTVYLMCLMFCVELNVLFSVNSVETLSRH